MGLSSDKKIDNVVTMRVRATSTHAAEISLLICEQMEKADSGYRRPLVPPSTPQNLGGTHLQQSIHKTKVGLGLELEVRHVGWVGGCMDIWGSRRSDNVVHLRVRAATLTHAAEISFLICAQMENADLASGRPPGRPPVNWVELDSVRTDFDMLRNGP